MLRITAITGRMPVLRAVMLATSMAGLVFGQTSRPATTPATKPATTQSTTQAFPRGNHPTQLLVDHAVAMALGWEKVVHDCYVINTPEEEEMVQGYMAMCRSLGRLRVVADKRWQNGFESIGFKRLLDEDRDKIVNADVVLAADKKHATVTPERSSPIQLGLVGDQWRILTRESHKNIPRRLIYLKAQVGAYEELANEIEAGKYSMAIEAQMAGFKKVKEAKAAADAKVKAMAPTTTPSTVPAP